MRSCGKCTTIITAPTIVPTIRNHALRIEAPSCGWHTIAAEVPAQKGLSSSSRKRRPKPHATWHLDELYLKIDGRMVYLWRAVDAEGEVLDVLVQSKRNKHAALKLMRKFLK